MKTKNTPVTTESATESPVVKESFTTEITIEDLRLQLLDEKASRKNWQYLAEVAMEELKKVKEK